MYVYVLIFHNAYTSECEGVQTEVPTSTVDYISWQLSNHSRFTVMEPYNPVCIVQDQNLTYFYTFSQTTSSHVYIGISNN